MLTVTFQRGITLVELMLATTLGLIAVAAVLSVYAASVHHGSAQLATAHLHQQLFGLLHLMSTDIRRAGYRQFDVATETVAGNPFVQGENRLRSQAFPDEDDDSCILFAYDLDKDGRVGVGRCDSDTCADNSDTDNVEQFGFRLRNLTIQSRFAGDSSACDSGYWQTLTDADIEITTLRFRLLEDCTHLLDASLPCAEDNPSLVQRAVLVQLEGQLVNQPVSAVRLSRWIVVRNDVLNLEKSVGSRKSTQALGAPGKPEKLLITNKVTTNFSDSPCTPISCMSFSRPTDLSRLKDMQ